MDRCTIFLDCPAYLDEQGAARCGLPAEVLYRYSPGSAGGPAESVKIRCPRATGSTGRPHSSPVRSGSRKPLSSAPDGHPAEPLSGSAAACPSPPLTQVAHVTRWIREHHDEPLRGRDRDHAIQNSAANLP